MKRLLILSAGSAILMLSAARSDAAPGTISASVSPAGPLAIGEAFTVSLHISGYTNLTQIDGYQFQITYPSALFSFVGPFDHGVSAPGLTQQWLAMPAQESAANGYAPAAADNSSLPGTIVIDYTDLGFSAVEGGTNAASGFLVSFKMTTLAAGTGSITPAAPPGGDTFFDVDFNPAGSPLFSGVIITAGTLTPIQSWRLAHFGTIDNTGRAADGADPEGDGLQNRAEFAFGLDPLNGDLTQLPHGSVKGTNYIIEFAQPAGVGGVTYGAEFSTTLAAGSWTAIPDTGTGGQHSFVLPLAGRNRLFVRMLVSVP